MRTTAAAALCLAVFAAFSVSVKRDLAAKESSANLTVKEMEDAVDFELPTTSGDTIALRDVVKAKKLTMINFWATWCGPCRLEMPQFEKMYKEQKEKGFELLAISCDQDADALTTYLARKPVSFPVLHDPEGRVAALYGVKAYPTTILIDANGKVISIFEGMNQHLEFTVQMHLGKAESGG